MFNLIAARCIALLFFIFTGAIFAAPVSRSSGIPGTASVASVNLKESILFALDRDPSVTRQAALMGIGAAQIDEARSGWLPKIGLTGSTGHSQTNDSSGSLKNSASWGLTLTQLVYDFGKTNSAIYQQEARHEGYRYQLMATLTSVAEKTALGYVEVLRYEALTKAVNETIAGHEHVLNLALLRSDAGVSSSSDVLQTQTRISGLRATLQQYEASLRSAKARLSVLTGIDAHGFAALPPRLNIRQESLDSIDYALIPSVLAARSAVSSTQYAVDRAKAEHWPTVNLKGARTRYQSNNRSYWDDQVQLSVDAPIYQGGAISARVQQAEGERHIAQAQVEQARFDVLQKASVAMADWNGARGRMLAGQAQLESAQRTREVYKSEYTLSKRSINDLLSVEQDVWQAAVSKITAEYDSWLAAINYAAAIDDLLPAVGIEKHAAAQLPELN